MKRTYLSVIAALLLMVPIATGVAYAADTTKSPPPIGQMLVREGDYALKLAQALKVKPATTEADAENTLAAIGIAPENGWISDFPVTPDIVAEIQTTIDAAAGSGKLTMSKADADSAFEALNDEAGLSIAPGALVREGDYALKLAQALKVKPATTEAEAENTLAAIGITPKNGWISDFPVTPDVIAELQTAIDAAAGSGKLTMSKAEADSAFEALNATAGLTIAPGAEGYAEAPPYEDQTVINNYYADEGPPVITYYEPPEDYAYLYEWAPFPFWCDGFFFPGYFVLSDFVFFGGFGHGHFGHRHEFGTHWHEPRHDKQPRDRPRQEDLSIDPVSRQLRSTTLNVTRGGRGGSFNRSSASHIFGRSVIRGGGRALGGGRGRWWLWRPRRWLWWRAGWWLWWRWRRVAVEGEAMAAVVGAGNPACSRTGHAKGLIVGFRIIYDATFVIGGTSSMSS